MWTGETTKQRVDRGSGWTAEEEGPLAGFSGLAAANCGPAGATVERGITHERRRRKIFWSDLLRFGQMKLGKVVRSKDAKGETARELEQIARRSIFKEIRLP